MRTRSGMSVVMTCLALAAATIGTQGCASQPSIGERMLSQGEGTADLGNQWESGSERVREGEKLIRKGEKQVDAGREEIEDGEARIRQGRNMMENGKQMMADSERAYRERFPQTYQQRLYDKQ